MYEHMPNLSDETRNISIISKGLIIIVVVVTIIMRYNVQFLMSPPPPQFP